MCGLTVLSWINLTTIDLSVNAMENKQELLKDLLLDVSQTTPLSRENKYKKFNTYFLLTMAS